MNIVIRLKDINDLTDVEVAAIMSRLSWPDSGSDSSIQKELRKRYVDVQPGPHPNMRIAMIWYKETFIAWVGTRPWPEKFKGKPITAQTIECFTDPGYRRLGFARIGLQSLISTGFLDKDAPVSVYAPDVVGLARSCGCKTVILCES